MPAASILLQGVSLSQGIFEFGKELPFTKGASFLLQGISLSQGPSFCKEFPFHKGPDFLWQGASFLKRSSWRGQSLSKRIALSQGLRKPWPFARLEGVFPFSRVGKACPFSRVAEQCSFG